MIAKQESMAKKMAITVEQIPTGWVTPFGKECMTLSEIERHAKGLSVDLEVSCALHGRTYSPMQPGQIDQMDQGINDGVGI
jgi:hypothetical protein